MGFRLASESMNLNDLERPNDLRCALSLRQLSFLSRMVAGVCVHLSDLLVYVRWALLLELNYVDLHMLNKRPYTHTATETATTDWTFLYFTTLPSCRFIPWIFRKLNTSMPLPPTTGCDRHYVVWSYVRPSGRCTFTPLSRDVIALYLVEGFQWYLAQILITCVGNAVWSKISCKNLHHTLLKYQQKITGGTFYVYRVVNRQSIPECRRRHAILPTQPRA